MWPPTQFMRRITVVVCSAIVLLPGAFGQKRATVPQTFRVRVTNEGHPRAGVLVDLQQGRAPQLGPAVRSETTDRNGDVQFEGVPPGDYTVRTSEWDRNDAIVVSVARGVTAAKQVSLRWPNLTLQHVQELRGTIHERGVRISAYVLRSGERIGSTESDGSGRFVIPNVRKGEYILRLQEEGPPSSLQVHGDIGVTVDKSAPAKELDLFLEMQRGVLSYGSFCHLPLNYKVTHLCGQVTDEHGVKLSGVRVSYLDRSGRRHSSFTDSAGTFDVKDSTPSETFLEITGTGYIPLRATGIRKGTEGTCQRPMRITLPKEETGNGCRSVRGIE